MTPLQMPKDIIADAASKLVVSKSPAMSDLGILMGVSRQTVRNFLIGKSVPSREHIKRLREQLLILVAMCDELLEHWMVK